MTAVTATEDNRVHANRRDLTILAAAISILEDWETQANEMYNWSGGKAAMRCEVAVESIYRAITATKIYGGANELRDDEPEPVNPDEFPALVEDNAA